MDSSGSALDAVKSYSVISQDRFFVSLTEIFAAENVLELDATRLGVETLVRKIGGKDEGLVSRFFDRIAETVIIAVEADKNFAAFGVTAKIFAGHHIGLRARQEFAIDIDL
jgi:hypothetical protein